MFLAKILPKRQELEAKSKKLYGYSLLILSFQRLKRCAKIKKKEFIKKTVEKIMKDKVNQYLREVSEFNAYEAETLEAFRVKFLGRKGIVQALFADFKQVPNENKKEVGLAINELKNAINEKIETLKSNIEHLAKKEALTNTDLTLDPPILNLGARHPISIVKNKIIDIFSRIGFTISEGPEIVDDWHNFTALNFPDDHPAKDMQDTFFIQRNPDVLLRTHTSSIQVQEMETKPLPIRTISIGRVYRNETITYKSHVQFHQVEGLFVDENVSFADLKQTLYHFVMEFFGDAYEVRFRPSYFPFTEPSAEMDIRPKGSEKWMEILGCGMVDPNVLSNCKIDPEKYNGFAFGMGIERMTMLRYGIKDIRVLYENDIRVLSQFVADH